MKNLININQNLFLKNLSIKNINQNYLNWFQDQEIKRNIINTNFFKLSDLKKYFLKEKKKKNTIFFGIFYKKKHIGNLKYEGIYKNSRKASFGILIGNKNYRGKEIGYKVINKSINFLIEKYRIKKFIISCKKNNYKALNLYKKLGFRIIKNLNNQVFLELDVFLSKVVIGTANFKNDKFSLNYNFALDQNYEDLNYNEIGLNMNFGLMNIDFDYLKESNHIGNSDYFKTKLNLNNNKNGLFAFETKRNLVTNSSEYYNLSYEYINDCLRAGLVYRREFYNDSELEPENSLLFKITLSPFGNIISPSFTQ